MEGSDDITQLLADACRGDLAADRQLFERVYVELRKIAKAHRRRWHGDHTLNTTALINEAYLKLAKRDQSDYNNRTHFFATASKAMRHILINYAERRSAAKRDGGVRELSADVMAIADDRDIDDLLQIDSLLQQLASSNERRCRVVECRVFGGMTIEETGNALKISAATVKRDWALASAWLYRELRPANSGVPAS